MDTNVVSSIDSPSSARQLPLVRQTDNSSFCTSKGSKITIFLQNVPEPVQEVAPVRRRKLHSRAAAPTCGSHPLRIDMIRATSGDR
ncbi:hypothetical protein F2Q70_00023307 [Brassica cretica]|uniref:Uncharacterized protein n=1 Tax=Brassica cretica TaxID=69181 RepID=A0A8S9HNS3_BRACR|nr:hypothetical protein F2Q70_00023307 [Brassica cretica]KAF2556918.1 hypothetical protein F2Q68_00017582 [Brassica cretica]